MTKNWSIFRIVFLTLMTSLKWSPIVFIFPVYLWNSGVENDYHIIFTTLIFTFVMTIYTTIVSLSVVSVLYFVSERYFQNPQHNENLYRMSMTIIGGIAGALVSIVLSSVALWDGTNMRPISYQDVAILSICATIVMLLVSHVFALHYLDYHHHNPKKGTKT